MFLVCTVMQFCQTRAEILTRQAVFIMMVPNGGEIEVELGLCMSLQESPCEFLDWLKKGGV